MFFEAVILYPLNSGCCYTFAFGADQVPLNYLFLVLSYLDLPPRHKCRNSDTILRDKTHKFYQANTMHYTIIGPTSHVCCYLGAGAENLCYCVNARPHIILFLFSSFVHHPAVYCN